MGLSLSFIEDIYVLLTLNYTMIYIGQRLFNHFFVITINFNRDTFKVNLCIRLNSKSLKRVLHYMKLCNSFESTIISKLF